MDPADGESAQGPEQGEPTPAVPQSSARDNWFVEFFDGLNLDMWVREPGDKLTLRQKVDIVGQITMVILVTGLAIWFIVYIAVSLDEWQPGLNQSPIPNP